MLTIALASGHIFQESFDSTFVYVTKELNKIQPKQNNLFKHKFKNKQYFKYILTLFNVSCLR